MEMTVAPKRSLAARVLGRETAEEICQKIDDEAKNGLGFVVMIEGFTSQLVRPQVLTERRLEYEYNRMSNGSILCAILATTLLGTGIYLAKEHESRMAGACAVAGVGMAAGSRHYGKWASHYHHAYTRIRRENNA